MNSPLVSVIIPNYCHSKYLDQRIQSVLNQTYQNFEVIILDDASPDEGKSKAVIEKYRDDPHVSHIVYNQSNSGNTFIQWNRGIQLASGEYCWIAESDDYCDDDLLETLIHSICSQKDTVLAYSTTWYVNDHGQKYARFKEGRNQLISGKDFIVKYLTLENSVQNASCAIFSKRVALQINTSYLNYKGIGDYWFWLEIAEQGNVVIVNKHLSYFRRHSDTVTSKYVTSGENLVNERELVNYIINKYKISRIRRSYISYYQVKSKKFITFDTLDIQKRMAEIWEFDRIFTIPERIIAKVFSVIRNRFLIYL